jgi:hypothetical protein
MAELRDEFLAALRSRSRGASTFMVAATLIRGLNDGPAHARALADLLRPLRDAGERPAPAVPRPRARYMAPPLALFFRTRAVPRSSCSLSLCLCHSPYPSLSRFLSSLSCTHIHV